MTFSLGVAATAFALILPVEFPDKTFVATLVLATRFPPRLVWIGVSAAFVVQTLVAVTAGALLAQLPRLPVQMASGLMFLVGSVFLFSGAGRADRRESHTEAEFEQRTERRGSATSLGAVVTSFLVLFLAEWGDLSQILTANLVARYEDPLSVGIGAFLALATVSGLAAALGRQLLRRIRLATIQRVGAAVCLLLAVITIADVLGIALPIVG